MNIAYNEFIIFSTLKFFFQNEILIKPIPFYEQINQARKSLN
jgi:hypothetical protein